MPRDIPAHYVKGNAAARVPDRIVCLDTESTREHSEIGEDQRWNLGVASFSHWSSKGNVIQSISRFTGPLDMWQTVSAFTRPKRRTVLYAHNLGYDIRTSRAMEIMPRLGWSLVDARIDDRSSWFKWTRHTATLVMCDSLSIFPIALGKLADMMGMVKPPLPAATDKENLFLRCEQDVNILTTAVLEYIAWLRTGECGNWQITGAGQSWAHWRHSHYTHKILVHDNEELLKVEQRAMWTGRCEAWKWGRDNHERVHEYDYANSYPRIARDARVPTRFRGAIVTPTLGSITRIAERYCVLADVTVTTGKAVVPCEEAGRIVWPIGRFRTVLWDPEIRLLHGDGVRVDVHRAWYYRAEPALHQWGEWVLNQIHDTTGEVPEWKKLVLKNWSRTLIGRFSMKYKSWDHVASSTSDGCYISRYVDLDTRESTLLMQMGTDILLQGEERDGPDSCPQITGYIMSVARAKLWEAIQIAGPDNVLYMDTDSLVVTTAGRNRLESHKEASCLAGLVLKSTSRGYRIYGPRAIILDRSRKVSGLPTRSQETQDHTFEGEVWESLSHAMSVGDPGRVRIRYRRHHLRPNPSRRHLCHTGNTAPYQLPDAVPSCDCDQLPELGTQALANGYPPILLGLQPDALKREPTPPDRGLRYSVRAE